MPIWERTALSSWQEVIHSGAAEHNSLEDSSSVCVVYACTRPGTHLDPLAPHFLLCSEHFQQTAAASATPAVPTASAASAAPAAPPAASAASAAPAAPAAAPGEDASGHAFGLLQHCLWTEIAPLLLEHPAGWHPRRHLECCGQSCGCCRSHNIEDAHEGGNCQPCFTGWVLSCVSRSARVCLRAYSRRLAVIANCQLRKSFGAMMQQSQISITRSLTMADAETSGAAEHGSAVVTHASASVHQLPETSDDVMALSRLGPTMYQATLRSGRIWQGDEELLNSLPQGMAKLATLLVRERVVQAKAKSPAASAASAAPAAPAAAPPAASAVSIHLDPFCSPAAAAASATSTVPQR
jgi:guanyl-specific ribonuclease Sa